MDSLELENLALKLGSPSLPEMVFGANTLALTHSGSGLQVRFDAVEALHCWDFKHNPVPKLAYSDTWQMSRRPSDKSIFKRTYDWTFTTDYKGSIVDTQDSASTRFQPQPSDTGIDIALLKRPDPILFFQEVVLYEDELADNGCSQLSVRLRVMPTCWFVLQRFWLRVDDVMFRVHDTRYFHKFGVDHVIREFSVREGENKDMKMIFPPDRSMHADPNNIVHLLPVVSQTQEKIPLA